MDLDLSKYARLKSVYIRFTDNTQFIGAISEEEIGDEVFYYICGWRYTRDGRSTNHPRYHPNVKEVLPLECITLIKWVTHRLPEPQDIDKEGYIQVETEDGNIQLAKLSDSLAFRDKVQWAHTAVWHKEKQEKLAQLQAQAELLRKQMAELQD